MFIIAGSRIRPATSPSSAERALERLGVVERDDARGLGGAGRVAEAVGDRGGVLAVAHLVRRRLDRDHHGVVVAVVGALDLDDHVAPGEAAREVDGVHRRLGAGVGEAPVGEAPAAAQLLGDDDRALGRRREVRALVHLRLDGGGDDRVGVADAHDAEAVVEVEVLVAVDVPHLRAAAALDVGRPRVVALERRRNAARHDACARSKYSPDRRVRSTSRAFSRSVRVVTLGKAAIVTDMASDCTWWRGGLSSAECEPGLAMRTMSKPRMTIRPESARARASDAIPPLGSTTLACDRASTEVEYAIAQLASDGLATCSASACATRRVRSLAAAVSPRSAARFTFPLAVLGSSSAKSTTRGTCTAPSGP